MKVIEIGDIIQGETALRCKSSLRIIECESINPYSHNNEYIVETKRGNIRRSYDQRKWDLVDLSSAGTPPVESKSFDNDANVKLALSAYDEAIRKATVEFTVFCCKNELYQGLPLIAEHAANHAKLMLKLTDSEVTG